MSHWGCHSFQCQGPLCLFSVPTVHHQCLPWSHQQHALMTWLWSWNLINFVALVNSDLHASFSFLKQDAVVCIFSVSQNPMYEMVGLLLAILEGGCTFPLLWQSTQREAIKEVFTFHSCFENIIYQLGERVMEKMTPGLAAGVWSNWSITSTVRNECCYPVSFPFFSDLFCQIPPLPSGWCHLY